MKKITQKLPFYFLFGAFLYPIIEILYRGYTHFSMAILGGLCFCAIFLVHAGLGPGRIVLKALFSAIIITQLEFLCGVLVNLVLNLSVWDYSDQPFHLLGQICPLFSFFWFLLSFIPLLSFEKKKVSKDLLSFKKKKVGKENLC